MILPDRITLEVILSRCKECPDCGAMTLYPRSNKKRPPVLSFTLNGKERQEYVRRVVWQLKHPAYQVPDGVDWMVASKCPNLHCVNPDLVYRGSRSQVFKAAVKNGAWSDPVPKARAVKGRRAKSKLPDHGVEDIRNSDEPVGVLAQKWDISTRYVRTIQTGKSRGPLVTHWPGLMPKQQGARP